MGKAALIAVLAFGVMGTVYAISSGQARMSTEGHTAAYQHEVTARSAAMAGLERAKQALADNFSSPPSSLKGDYGDIPYEVDISIAGDVATVTSRGLATAADGTALPFNIRAVYEQKVSTINGIATDAPELFEYAMIADDHLYLHGNMNVAIEVGADSGSELNANVHSNTSLTAQGNVRVQGFGTSTGSIDVIGNAAFQPSDNPNNAPTTQQVADKIEIPEFSVAEFQSFLASSCTGGSSCPTVMNYTSGLTINSSNKEIVESLAGTRNAPVYILVEGGELRITSNVTIPGYVVFVAQDGFSISGNITLGGTSYDGGLESSVAIYTPGAGEISMTGTGVVYGQIVASGHVQINGNVNIYGSIATGETITIGGNPRIFYREASPALTRLWNEEPITFVELISYNEW